MAEEAVKFPSSSALLPRTNPESPLGLAEDENAQSGKLACAVEKETRKCSTTKNSMRAEEENNTGKARQSKSRNGCVTCKAKRLKCDEEKPGCQQCAKRKVECGGYAKELKWRPFEESNVRLKINVDQQKQASPPNPLSATSSTSPTPTLQFPPRPPAGERPQAKNKDNKRPNALNESVISASLPQRPAKAKRKQRQIRQEAQPTSPCQAPPEATPLPKDGNAECRDELDRTSGSQGALSLTLHSATAPELGHSPTLTEILLPYASETSNHAGFVSFSLPEGMHYPTVAALHTDGGFDENSSAKYGSDELFSNNDPPTSQLPVYLTSRRQTPSTSHSSSSSDELLVGPWAGSTSNLYRQPGFSQDSPEMLTFRYDKLTCGILSIMDGPSENPWRNLIWPLSQKSPALYHAILAMTAFHASADVPSLRVTGHEHKQASIRFIKEGIRDNSMNDQAAIATALALGFAESWDQHTATGNTHIKGAQALVKRALAEHQRTPLPGVQLSRLKFLCNAWVYMDVIARLTSVDSDESNDFDNTFLFSADPPQMVMGDSEQPGFGIDFGIPVDALLDPLMGCANTLFPLVGRVANLVRKVCRSQANSPAVISQANDLKLALETWEPPAFIERPEDPSTDVQHTLQTAEAYRWATLLHLHQSVPELPSLDSSELAQRVLQYLATVPLASRTVVVQIYPLMVAGCEAKTDEDRQWVRDRWSAMGQRMRIGVIEKCAIVTEEVWRRKDVYEAQPTTRRKLVATADLQPARQRGAKLVHPDPGPRDDPGRTGMVFSYVEAEGDPKQNDSRWPKRKNVPNRVMGNMDPAYTVRGHLHWVGVMWDWGWEVLLG